MPFKVPTATTPTVPYVLDCERCTHQQAPLVCKRCKCAAYCSADHQKADAQRHRKLCKPVADARAAMEKEEKALLEEDPYVFEIADGSFYLMDETRPYMHAKYAFIKQLAHLTTFLGTEYALKEANESLFLNEQDDLAVRDVVPALFLLQGRLQEAYDFIRFWATYDEGEGEGEDDDEEDDNDMEEDQEDRPKTRAEVIGVAPSLKPLGADMTEPLDVFVNKPYIDSAFHRCALSYIKVVISHALKGAVSMLSDPNTGEEAKAEVMAFLVANKLPLEVEAMRVLQATVEQQAIQAMRLTHEKNSWLWGPLQDPTGRTIVMIGATTAPKAERDRLEAYEWIMPYSELWRAEGYMIQFIDETIFPDLD